MASLLATCTVILSFHIHASLSQLDPFTQWNEQSTPRLPNAQSSLLVGYHEATNRIWLIGGDDNNNIRNEIWYYDITTDQFTDAGSSSFHLDELYSQSSTQVGNSIYYVSSDSANTNRPLLERWQMGMDYASSNFYTLGALTNNENILSPCLASKDDRFIFIVGGEDLLDADDAVDTFQIFDLSTGKIYTGPPLNGNRRYLSCNVSPLGDALYVFGGQYKDSNGNSMPQTSVEKLDISDLTNAGSTLTLSSSWTVTSMTMDANTFYSRSDVDVVNNLIYVIGGRREGQFNYPADDSISIIDPSDDTLYLSSTTLNTARSAPAVINVAQKLYVFGGYATDNTLIDTFEVSALLPTHAPTDSV